MQAGTYFPKVRRMLLFLAPLILTHFWPASTLLRGHLALATLSPPETDPQILERWACADEGFWSRILVWRAIAFVNFTRWIVFCMSELFRKIDFGGLMSWKTQPNCRALDDRCSEGPRSISLPRFLPGCPDLSWPWLITGLSYQSPFFSIATALFLPSFFLDLLVGWSSTWRCA